ncbi:MAG: S8 family serine peptidase [Planctomycetes bacterium]|nr:S8 family serine peptidase [Planctomycetota bacterium]
MHRTLLSAAALAAVIASLSAQEPVHTPTQRWVNRPTTPFRVDAERMVEDHVVVKFAEGLRVRLGADGLRELAGADLTATRTLLARFRVERLFTRPVDDLDDERAVAQRNVPAGEPPLADLNNYYRVTTAGARATEELVDALLARPEIETAWCELRPVPTDDIPPVTPLFESQQTYLDAPPAGYGYRRYETIVGARGQGVQLAQLEGRHTYGHEDADTLVRADLLGSFGSNYASWESHGTACVGIMAASRNDYGVRGMGSDCDRFYTASLQSGAENMVSLATAVMQPGDVMSSSYAWVVSYGGTDYHAPADWVQSVYDATRIAAAQGIVYAYSAGNTNADLANTSIYGGRYAPGSTPSGGFIVGASGAGDGAKASFSNYGAFVVANAWGRGVATIAYGDMFDPGDVLQRYTAGFGGTSAAAPGLAGVVASLSGAVEAQSGTPPTLAQIRAALTQTGTPITGNVGTRPDLGQLLARFGLPDGLLAGDGQPGGSVTLEVSGPAGTPFGAVISTGTGSTPIGANRPLLLDTNVLIPWAFGFVGASGTTLHTENLPNDPSLIGIEFYVQAAQDRGGALHLTNTAMVWIRA